MFAIFRVRSRETLTDGGTVVGPAFQLQAAFNCLLWVRDPFFVAVSPRVPVGNADEKLRGLQAQVRHVHADGHARAVLLENAVDFGDLK